MKNRTDKHGWPLSCVVCGAAIIHESYEDLVFYKCGGEGNKWGWIGGDWRCDELNAINPVNRRGNHD
jgi:hypothetical protein